MIRSADTLRFAAITLAALTLLSPLSLAAEECTERADYAGPPRHAPVVSAWNIAPAEGALPESEARTLDAAFVRLREGIGAPSLSAAVLVPGGGLWQQTVAPEDAPLLFWASAGKMATAIVVLQLVEEGRITLDDRVSRWAPAVPHADLITIRDLLAHTAGLYSANEDEAARRNPHFLGWDEQLAIVTRRGPLFCPGAAWRYSNTGYAFLGEIVAAVEGEPIDAAITRRIIKPLGLATMRALSPGGSSEGVAPFVSASQVMLEPSWAGAAGPIVSDAADMARLLAALLGGKLLRPETTAAMLADLYPMFDAGTFYGLGLMLFEVPDGAATLRWIGHAGGTPGAGAMVAFSPADGAIIAVALTGDGSAAAAANFLLKQRAAAKPR